MLEDIKEIAQLAGEKTLTYYDGEVGVTYKEDESPLTLADQASHRLISDALGERFPEIPIISEEGVLPSFEERQKLQRFFLVDPLDGTKEFIKKNGEFTVNIALIENNQPVLGVVYLPVPRKTYAAQFGGPATLTTADGETREIHARDHFDPNALSAASSRSHPSAALDAFLKKFEGLELRGLGSALKFCFVADGQIDFYPRFGGLMEWDTAAAHAVALAAGMVITDLKGEPLGYNKEDMRHTGLIASSHRALADFLMARMDH